jgi:hypothetical protein
VQAGARIGVKGVIEWTADQSWGTTTVKVILDFKGGPFDGTVIGENMLGPGKLFTSMEQFLVVMAYLQTEGAVGQEFLIPSIGRFMRTVVRETPPSADAFVYQIAERLDGNGEVLLVANYVGLHPYPESFPERQQ